MTEQLVSLPEPCSSQGAREAGRRYAERAGEDAVLMSHSGDPTARWWLAAVLPYDQAMALYRERLMALRLGGAIAVWFDGGNVRYGEHFDTARY